MSDDSTPEIRILGDEGEFSPDEDSLQLAKDPLTGELRFPSPNDAVVDDAGVEESASADNVVDNSGIAETIELDDYGRPLGPEE